ncbi:MAG: hypothetical protein ACRERU_04675 [Methylococcales bacterium]
MNRIIFPRQCLAVLLLALVATNGWSYGGGGGQASKCTKPSFKDMRPPQSSVVSPGAEFSFAASSNTNPRSIKVVVKGHDVGLNVKKNGAVQVTGTLPPEVTEGYARINVSASSSANCAAQDGWLLKIGK